MLIKRNAPWKPETDANSATFRSRLNQVYELSRADKVHAAGDIVFDLVQGLLREEDFSACDQLLSMVDISKLKSELTITFLVMTFTARDKLQARRQYYSRVLAYLVEERGTERATRLLDKYR